MSPQDLEALERLVAAAGRHEGAQLPLDQHRQLKLAPHGRGWLFALEVGGGAAQSSQVVELLTRRWNQGQDYDGLLPAATRNDALMLVRRLPEARPETAGLAASLDAMIRLLGR